MVASGVAQNAVLQSLTAASFCCIVLLPCTVVLYCCLVLLYCTAVSCCCPVPLPCAYTLYCRLILLTRCTAAQVIAQLQVKNEELALRTARISEQDFEEVRTEFEQRLATAERKVGGCSL